MHFLCRCLFLAVFFLPLHGKPQENSGRIAFVVNKDAITKTALDFRLKLAAASSGTHLTSENYTHILPQIQEAMIHEALQLQEAEKEGITISQDDIDDAITHLEESSGMGKDAIAKMLKEHHIPRATLEHQVRAHLAWMDVVRLRHAGSLQLSDWEVAQELKRHQDQKNQHQYHLAEIVLPAETAEQERQSKNTIQHLVTQLRKGAHWGALAQQFSTSATAARGGDMGWMTEDTLSSEVKEALRHMMPGDISQPLKVGNQFMLIALVDSKKPGQTGKVTVSVTQAFIPYPFFATDDEKTVTLQKARTLASQTKSCRAFEQAVRTQANGESQNSGAMDLSHVNPDLAKTLSALKPGQIAAPEKTPDGVIVLMLCDWHEEKEKEWTEDDAAQSLIAKRLEQLARRELRDAKRAAFIEVRL